MLKYRNKPTNGYASKREAKRAAELKLLEKAGQIRDLREQVQYVLIPKQIGERECKYIADFVYEEPIVRDVNFGNRTETIRDWIPVCEDVKGIKTAVYKLKRKLMLKVHGIRVREV